MRLQFRTLVIALSVWTAVASLACAQQSAKDASAFVSGTKTAIQKGDPDDPFDPVNRLADAAEQAAGRKIRQSSLDDRIEFRVGISPPRVRRGDMAKLTIQGMPKPGFHTYPLTKRSAALTLDGSAVQDPIGLSKIIYKENPGLQPLWPVTETEPVPVNEEGVGTLLEHQSDFSWTQDILVLPEATPGTKVLRFEIRLQVCDKTCITDNIPFEVDLEVSDTSAVPLTAELEKRLKVKEQVIEEVIPPLVPFPGALEQPTTRPPEPSKNGSGLKDREKIVATPTKGAPAPSPDPSPALSQEAGSTRSDGLLGFILLGISFGAISLITPCVFPMIPITVSFFLKQSEKEHHQPLAMALVYSGTIVTVLTLGGVLLIRILQPVSQHWITNVVLGVLFAYFAFSLFGMYEIRLPTSLANLTSAQEGRGGLAGTVFMALTFTIISFTCVAPFYGSFIGLQASASSATDWVRLFLGALSFSVTFASPFFLLALFPSVLRKLPKSGSWMNTVKVVMGFLEIAAALKFLRAGELLVFGQARLLTYDMVLGLYVGLSLVCGVYLLGFFRLPHDDPVEHIGVPRFLLSLLFLSLGFYLLPGLFKDASGERQRPSGEVFAWLDSFLLQDPAPVVLPGMARDGNGSQASRDPAQRLFWLSDVREGLKEARDRQQLVFVDFTGLI
jgi:thiol:disulfide interchange protein